MAGSSFDEAVVESVAEALRAVRLEAIVVGAVGAILQGAPLTTQDVDLLVRRTPSNEKKITQLRKRLGGLGRVVVTSDVESLVGAGITVDLLFDVIPPSLKFESVRARATRMRVGRVTVLVASLEDIIRSKRAADRPKDRVHLPTLEQTLAVKRKLK